MILRNISGLDTETLRREFYRAARWAGVSLVGTYVEVVNANYKRSNGRFYSAEYVRKKGKTGRRLKWRKVDGYIRIYVKPARTLRDVILTFVHELSHLQDYRLKKEGKAIPPFREKRARRLAEQYGRVWIFEEVRKCYDSAKNIPKKLPDILLSCRESLCSGFSGAACPENGGTAKNPATGRSCGRENTLVMIW